MYIPASESDSTYVRLASRASGRTREIYDDQYTGSILGRKEQGPQLIWKIHELHINLTAGAAGSHTVVSSSLALLCLSLSGLYLWWPRKVFRFLAGPRRPHASITTSIAPSASGPRSPCSCSR
jgi:uncharacterized iron-regulated membrane protein